MSEILGLPAPVLPSLASTLTTSIVTGAGSSAAAGEEIGGPGSLWQDEEDKRFYEDLKELRGEVPGGVLGLAAKEAENEPTVEPAPADEMDVVDDPVDDTDEMECVWKLLRPAKRC